MSYSFPLDNIRYFYNPHGEDGWPDLDDISIRLQVLSWLSQNSLHEATLVVAETEVNLSLEEARDFNLSKLSPDEHELVSTSLRLEFANHVDRAGFAAEWGRTTWIRRKTFDTKYTHELFSIANCLWRVKAEFLSAWPGFMGEMSRNIQGRFDYCTFEEDRRCVIGFEFEHEEDAVVFDLLRRTR